MPELPDITVYLECLQPRVLGQTLEKARLRSPFLLRSVDPPLSAVEGLVVRDLRRFGKRIVLGFEEELFLVFHLMIAGRFRWQKQGAKIHGRNGLAAFDFPDGTLMLTEAARKRRASLYVVRGEEELAAHRPAGAEPLECDLAGFRTAIAAENRTLKRALTDQRLLSGIGNAYSDEILHRARLSPAKRTQQLADDEVESLFEATRSVLAHWIEKSREEVGSKFPDRVTAFRDGMAVHGRFGQPCPDCGDPVQRIVHAENESNYCATCQTDGKLLRDRALSRLFRDDWPKTVHG